MNKPQMIIFDYGHTLLYEPEFDFLRGEKEIYKHIVKNPRQLTVEDINKFGAELYQKNDFCRMYGYEFNNLQTMKLKYEYLGIELDISYEEAEIILWDSVSRGACMPYVEEMLECLKENEIRSGVISNIGWSGHALTERINRLLPQNQFEFIIASSEYGIRKPNSMLFELAIQKANLHPNDIWFCGDNVEADVYGARSVGIFPVFYEDETVDCPWEGQNDDLKIDFKHLHIHSWVEMINILKNLNNDMEY
ncbi:MAG: HAD family hydrolase [Clostridiales bacterium]|jgi:putative hydrolase of the HAD superfamily|nr:HAD family hydrolase [Clostridiales bacterium]